MTIHFIAIGGSAMHNLAIALHKKGFNITGSDDEIFEPSKSRLQQYGLLPQKTGWDTANIHKQLDAVILGMHARIDNPELKKAQELNIPIYSYPEYIYEQSKEKKRVVIGGSHGKTTITSMIMHVLKECKFDFDYMVGAQLSGFETMVKLTHKAPVIILEGDEYLSSPIDKRPKFHLYHPHIAVISGIAWDHVNVFPTFENYCNQFSKFIQLIKPNGTLFYSQEDTTIKNIIPQNTKNIKITPYTAHKQETIDGKHYLISEKNKYEIKIFGQHNMQNIQAAKNVCIELGINEGSFYKAIQTFKGANKRLQNIAESKNVIIYQDFAHSPSKLKATLQAIHDTYNDKKIIACIELHTFSSLQKSFLTEYANTMNAADIGMVYFNPHVLEHKKLPPLSTDEVKQSFNNNKLLVFNHSSELIQKLKTEIQPNSVVLLMSSGNFDGVNIKNMAQDLISTVKDC